MRKVLVRVLAAATVLTLSACASDSIEMSGDPAQVPAFTTFEIRDEQYVFSEPLSEEQLAKINSQMHSAAVDALQERGYKQASPADIVVVLGAVSRATPPAEEDDAKRTIRAVDTRVLEPGRPDVPTAGGDQDRMLGVGREGDLILYLLDPKTQRTVWRASSSGSATTPAEALRKVRATYRAMVQKLPPAR
jgi:hypothetical protein